MALMHNPKTPENAEILALEALGWLAGEEDGFDAMASNPEFAGIAGQMSEQMAAAAGMGIEGEDEEEEEAKPGATAAHPKVSYEDVSDDEAKG